MHHFDLNGSTVDSRAPLVVLAFAFFLSRYRVPGAEVEIRFRTPPR